MDMCVCDCVRLSVYWGCSSTHTAQHAPHSGLLLGALADSLHPPKCTPQAHTRAHTHIHTPAGVAGAEHHPWLPPHSYHWPQLTAPPALAPAIQHPAVATVPHSLLVAAPGGVIRSLQLKEGNKRNDTMTVTTMKEGSGCAPATTRHAWQNTLPQHQVKPVPTCCCCCCCCAATNCAACCWASRMKAVKRV